MHSMQVHVGLTVMFQVSGISELLTCAARLLSAGSSIKQPHRARCTACALRCVASSACCKVLAEHGCGVKSSSSDRCQAFVICS